MVYEPIARALIHNSYHWPAMKRFIGLLVTGVGILATLWGGYHIISGESATKITITQNFAITALASGLLGVALISFGLISMRD